MSERTPAWQFRTTYSASRTNRRWRWTATLPDMPDARPRRGQWRETQRDAVAAALQAGAETVHVPFELRGLPGAMT